MAWSTVLDDLLTSNASNFDLAALMSWQAGGYVDYNNTGIGGRMTCLTSAGSADQRVTVTALNEIANTSQTNLLDIELRRDTNTGAINNGYQIRCNITNGTADTLLYYSYSGGASTLITFTSISVAGLGANGATWTLTTEILGTTLKVSINGTLVDTQTVTNWATGNYTSALIQTGTTAQSLAVTEYLLEANTTASVVYAPATKPNRGIVTRPRNLRRTPVALPPGRQNIMWAFPVRTQRPPLPAPPKRLPARRIAVALPPGRQNIMWAFPVRTQRPPLPAPPKRVPPRRIAVALPPGLQNIRWAFPVRTQRPPLPAPPKRVPPRRIAVALPPGLQNIRWAFPVRTQRPALPAPARRLPPRRQQVIYVAPTVIPAVIAPATITQRQLPQPAPARRLPPRRQQVIYVAPTVIPAVIAPATITQRQLPQPLRRIPPRRIAVALPAGLPVVQWAPPVLTLRPQVRRYGQIPHRRNDPPIPGSVSAPAVIWAPPFLRADVPSWVARGRPCTRRQPVLTGQQPMAATFLHRRPTPVVARRVAPTIRLGYRPLVWVPPPRVADRRSPILGRRGTRILFGYSAAAGPPPVVIFAPATAGRGRPRRVSVARHPVPRWGIAPYITPVPPPPPAPTSLGEVITYPQGPLTTITYRKRALGRV